MPAAETPKRHVTLLDHHELSRCGSILKATNANPRHVSHGLAQELEPTAHHLVDIWVIAARGVVSTEVKTCNPKNDLCIMSALGASLAI